MSLAESGVSFRVSIDPDVPLWKGQSEEADEFVPPKHLLGKPLEVIVYSNRTDVSSGSLALALKEEKETVFLRLPEGLLERIRSLGSTPSDRELAQIQAEIETAGRRRIPQKS